MPQFKFDPLWNAKPVKLTQQWANVLILHETNVQHYQVTMSGRTKMMMTSKLWTMECACHRSVTQLILNPLSRWKPVQVVAPSGCDMIIRRTHTTLNTQLYSTEQRPLPSWAISTKHQPVEKYYSNSVTEVWPHKQVLNTLNTINCW